MNNEIIDTVTARICAANPEIAEASAACDVARENKEAAKAARNWTPNASHSDGIVSVREIGGGLAISFKGFPSLEYAKGHFDNPKHLFDLLSLAAACGRSAGLGDALNTIGGRA